MTSLGFLYPGRTAADDYPRMEQLIGSDIRLYLVHADGPGTDATGPVAEDGPGLDVGAVPVPTGSADRLAAVGEELRLSGAEAVVWAGPGFALGPEGAQEQVRALARAAGCPRRARRSASCTRSVRWARGGSPSRPCTHRC